MDCILTELSKHNVSRINEKVSYEVPALATIFFYKRVLNSTKMVVEMLKS